MARSLYGNIHCPQTPQRKTPVSRAILGLGSTGRSPLLGDRDLVSPPLPTVDLGSIMSDQEYQESTGYSCPAPRLRNSTTYAPLWALIG